MKRLCAREATRPAGLVVRHEMTLFPTPLRPVGPPPSRASVGSICCFRTLNSPPAPREVRSRPIDERQRKARASNTCPPPDARAIFPLLREFRRSEEHTSEL